MNLIWSRIPSDIASYENAAERRWSLTVHGKSGRASVFMAALVLQFKKSSLQINPFAGAESSTNMALKREKRCQERSEDEIMSFFSKKCLLISRRRISKTGPSSKVWRSWLIFIDEECSSWHVAPITRNSFSGPNILWSNVLDFLPIYMFFIDNHTDLLPCRRALFAYKERWTPIFGPHKTTWISFTP